MGDDGDGNPLHPFVEAAVAEGARGAYFNAHSPGRAAPAASGDRAGRHDREADAAAPGNGDGSPLGVRYYQDLLAPKLPASKASRHGGNGPTSFHQDFITFAVDRTGGLTFWIRSRPTGPRAGTMSFVDGSHRLGVMGDYTTYGDGDALTAFPELQDLEMSPPMHYELGDVTVHTHLTIHGASENRTERPRWAWLVIVQPEDVCWNGSPCPNFDHRAMRRGSPCRATASRSSADGRGTRAQPGLHADVLARARPRGRHRGMGPHRRRGPFFWFDDVGATEGRHRGEPADFPTSTAAIAYAGDMQIELVCQENDEPGIFRDLFPRQHGLHHVAVVCEDYEAERDAYVAAGAEVAYEAFIGGHPHVLGRHLAHPRLHGRAARAEPGAGHGLRRHARRRRGVGRHEPDHPLLTWASRRPSRNCSPSRPERATTWP